MNRPSKEWLKRAADTEDGKSVSVGGLACDAGMIAPPPLGGITCPGPERWGTAEHVDDLVKQIGCLTSALADKTERLGAAQVALRIIEWYTSVTIGDRTHKMCPVCCGLYDDGHKPDCYLAIALKEPVPERS